MESLGKEEAGLLDSYLNEIGWNDETNREGREGKEGEEEWMKSRKERRRKGERKEEWGEAEREGKEKHERQNGKPVLQGETDEISRLSREE